MAATEKTIAFIGKDLIKAVRFVRMNSELTASQGWV